jgi:hypothetical protein
MEKALDTIKVYLGRIDVKNVNGLILTKDLAEAVIKKDKTFASEFHYTKVRNSYRASQIDLDNACAMLSGLHLVGDRIYANADFFGPKATLIDLQQLRDYPERRFFAIRCLVNKSKEIALVTTWDFLGMWLTPGYVDEIEIKPEFSSKC